MRPVDSYCWMRDFTHLRLPLRNDEINVNTTLRRATQRREGYCAGITSDLVHRGRLQSESEDGRRIPIFVLSGFRPSPGRTPWTSFQPGTVVQADRKGYPLIGL